jgi:hypothetical protein
MIEQLISARKVGTPLVCVRTPDPQLTVNAIVGSLSKTKDGKPVCIFIWDCITGITGITDTAKAYVQSKLKDDTTNAVGALEAGVKLPDESILILCNAHRGVTPPNPNWIQAVWNLRQPYKISTRTLVMLCPDITLPAELAQDVMLIDEALPDTEQLRKIILSVLEAVGETEPDAGMVDKAIDATCGLAAFPAEQVSAMSLYRNGDGKVGMKLDDLWRRKAQMIEQTPGLSVWRGGQKFSDIGGYDNVKGFLSRIVKGKRSPRGVVFMDEIEKLFGGSSAGTVDTSGTTQGFLGTLLSYMQDSDASGCIFIGPPGSGKSAIGQALGAEAGVPTIAFDANGMKDSLVGASEARLRNALKVVTAVTQGRSFWVATCNKIASLPPELRRRFKSGTFFFDLPGPEEREVIWNIYLRRYDIPVDTQRPDDTDWTGAEIKQCCYLAAEELGCTLMEAAQYIVPVAKSAEDEITRLRAMAHGRFISASQPGFYRHEGVATAEAANRIISEIPTMEE